MPKLPKLNKGLGAYVFLAGIFLSVIMSFITWSYTTIVLALLAVLVALMNIKPKEENKFLLWTIALGVIGPLTLGVNDYFPLLEGILTNIGTYFTAIAVVFVVVIGFKYLKKQVNYMARKKSRRTTYKKKSTAKKARKKGQSVYKVKKGYRLSKK